jgi:hypothetical protein
MKSGSTRQEDGPARPRLTEHRRHGRHRAAGLKLGVDPLGGAVHYWELINEIYNLTSS